MFFYRRDDGGGGGQEEKGSSRESDASHHSVVCSDETEIEIEKARFSLTRASFKTTTYALVSDDVEGTKKIYKGIKKRP